MDSLELGDMQGILGGNYGRLDHSVYFLLRIDDAPAAKGWLQALRAGHWFDDAEQGKLVALHKHACAVTLAFTAPGLRKLGLGDEALRTFVSEFQEGMPVDARARALGDIGPSAPKEWLWGSRQEIDILLVVHSTDQRVVDLQMTRVEWCVGEIGKLPGFPTVVHRVDGFVGMYEPFGFADGISQPRIEGFPATDSEKLEQAIRAGEFVLGYLNEAGNRPASPSIDARLDPGGLLPRVGPGARADLGRNGTYLVLRQLKQHVLEFRKYTQQDERTAARMVGRWRSGAPLVRHEYDPGPGYRENDFSYHREDRAGLRCPIGAHIRRSNPRDALADDAGLPPAEAVRLVNQHRILRRARVYSATDEVGLMFACLNANIERQFEFVQQSWIMSPGFGGLRDETDPLLGNCPAHGKRHMTLPDRMLRTRMDGLPQFVTVRGGAYFFMPGLRAIDVLAALP